MQKRGLVFYARMYRKILEISTEEVIKKIYEGGAR